MSHETEQGERNTGAPLRATLRATQEHWVPAALTSAILIVYLAYIHRYGVNVPFWDDWTLGQYYFGILDGRLRLGDLLIAKNNEHLVGVPFTLMILFHFFTDYNGKSILYLSAALQVASFALLLALAWPLLPRGRWRGWHAIVLALLVFSLAPTQNILWGFQTVWNFITLFLFSSLWFLARAVNGNPGTRTSAVVIAAVLATLASFCSVQGLLVWIAGAVLLVAGIEGGLRDSLRDTRFLLWVALALSCFGLYGWVFSLTPTPHLAPPDAFKSTFAAPLAIGRFMLAIMSTVWGQGLGALVPIAGTLVAIVCTCALIAVIFSKRRAQLALPLALLIFGTVCTLSVAVGRLPFGESTALQSRYGTNVLIALAGSYLILLHAADEARTVAPAVILRGVVVIIIGAAFIVSGGRAIEAGREWRLERSIGAMILLNAEHEPRFKIERSLCWNADILMQQLPKLRARSLGSFADGISGDTEAAIYAVPPVAFTKLIENRPADRKALERLWDVYVVGPDLRSALPLSSPTFALDLVRWAAQSAGGDHYLAKYLRDFAPDYERILADLVAPTGQRS